MCSCLESIFEYSGLESILQYIVFGQSMAPRGLLLLFILAGLALPSLGRREASEAKVAVGLFAQTEILGGPDTSIPSENSTDHNVQVATIAHKSSHTSNRNTPPVHNSSKTGGSYGDLVATKGSQQIDNITVIAKTDSLQSDQLSSNDATTSRSKKVRKRWTKAKKLALNPLLVRAKAEWKKFDKMTDHGSNIDALPTYFLASDGTMRHVVTCVRCNRCKHCQQDRKFVGEGLNRVVHIYNFPRKSVNFYVDDRMLSWNVELVDNSSLGEFEKGLRSGSLLKKATLKHTHHHTEADPLFRFKDLTFWPGEERYREGCKILKYAISPELWLSPSALECLHARELCGAAGGEFLYNASQDCREEPRELDIHFPGVYGGEGVQQNRLERVPPSDMPLFRWLLLVMLCLILLLIAAACVATKRQKEANARRESQQQLNGSRVRRGSRWRQEFHNFWSRTLDPQH